MRSSPPTRARLAWLTLAAVLGGLVAPAAAQAAAAASPRFARVTGTQVQVKQGPALDPRRLRASALRATTTPALSTAPTSTWQVSYTGFTTAQHDAFQAAVDIWSRIVSSPVPITVDASFAALPPGVLGSAGPTYAYYDPTLGDGVSLYPGALASAMIGTDVDPSSSDITAQFSSVASNVYYGTDGNPPSGQIDFESVVLHELGHGLGFVGGMSYSGGVGSKSNPRTVYDLFPVDSAGASLQASPSYPDGSTALGSALTSGSLWWSGAQATALNGGVRPRLYAPSTWSSGSSYAHLDEASYPAGSPNSLMTPQISAQEVIRTPGPIVVGILRDLGWTANLPPSAPSAPGAVTAWPLDGAAHLSWSPAADNGSPVDHYTVTAIGGPVVVTPTAATSIDVPGLTNGTPYSFTVTAHNDAGDGPASPASAAVTPSAVDTVAPTATITSGPPAITRSTAATFGFSADDHGWPGVITFTCALDGGPALPCASGQTYSGLSNGLHTMALTALDGALNAGTAQRSWRVDTIAPAVSAQVQPVWTIGSTMTLRYSGSDGGSGVASYAVRTRKAPYGSSFGAMSYPSSWQARTATSTSQAVARGYTYCMSVRSTDRAGNVSAWSAERCTAVPLDDRSLATSSGWTRASGSGYYAGTVTTARKAGVALSRGSVQTRRISLVALTCASCGSVRVYWNGVLIRTVSLVTTTTRTRVLLSVVDFGGVRSGTVVLRTTSTRPVYLDGLALSRV